MDDLQTRDGDCSPGYRSGQQKRSDSPEFSCVSMKSDASMKQPLKFKDGDTLPGQRLVQQKRSDSPEFSCVSTKSDTSMTEPLKFKDGHMAPAQRLRFCDITDEGCAALASALRSNPSHLTELDLLGNYPERHSIELLSNLKKNPKCKLRKMLCNE